MMKYSEQFMEHIEYAFAAFCKIVLRNVAISAYRDFGRKQKYEVSLDYLMSETSFEPFATDNYFEQYVYALAPRSVEPPQRTVLRRRVPL